MEERLQRRRARCHDGDIDLNKRPEPELPQPPRRIVRVVDQIIQYQGAYDPRRHDERPEPEQRVQRRLLPARQIQTADEEEREGGRIEIADDG